MIGADHEWRFVEDPVEPTGPGHDGVLCLEARAQEAGVAGKLLNSADGGSAIIFSSRAFCQLVADFSEGRADSTQAIVDGADDRAVVCVGTHLEQRSLEALLAYLGRTLGRPFYIAVVGQGAIRPTSSILAALEKVGASEFDCGLAQIEPSSSRLEFLLFAVAETAKGDAEALLTGAPTKIGEVPDNLDGRARWFKRFSG